MVGCVLMAPQWRSIAAPLLGPWAGIVLGHADCTMASVAPGWTALSCVLVAASVGALLLGPSRRRWWTAALVGCAALAWSLAALASVANTQS